MTQVCLGAQPALLTFHSRICCCLPMRGQAGSGRDSPEGDGVWWRHPDAEVGRLQTRVCRQIPGKWSHVPSHEFHLYPAYSSPRDQLASPCHGAWSGGGHTCSEGHWEGPPVWWALLLNHLPLPPVSSEARVRPTGCLSGAGLQLCAEWGQGIIWKSTRRPFSTHCHSLLVKGEDGPEGRSPPELWGPPLLFQGCASFKPNSLRWKKSSRPGKAGHPVVLSGKCWMRDGLAGARGAENR